MSSQLECVINSDDLVGHYINGKNIADVERLQPVSNPATGDHTGESLR